MKEQVIIVGSTATTFNEIKFLGRRIAHDKINLKYNWVKYNIFHTHENEIVLHWEWGTKLRDELLTSDYAYCPHVPPHNCEIIGRLGGKIVFLRHTIETAVKAMEGYNNIDYAYKEAEAKWEV